MGNKPVTIAPLLKTNTIEGFETQNTLTIDGSGNDLLLKGGDATVNVATGNITITDADISLTTLGDDNYSISGFIGADYGIRIATFATANNRNVTRTDAIIFANATSKGITINLPSTNLSAGRLIFIKKTDSSSNQVAIIPTAGFTIEGNTSEQLTAQYQGLFICYDGASTWYKLNNTSVISGTTTSTSTTTTSTTTTSSSTTTTSSSTSTTTTSSSTSTTTTSSSTSTSTSTSTTTTA